jgi:hypothetical protein
MAGEHRSSTWARSSSRNGSSVVAGLIHCIDPGHRQMPACATHLGLILPVGQAESSDQVAGNRKQLATVVALVAQLHRFFKDAHASLHLLFLLAF